MNMSKTRYFEVHVRYAQNDGYSVFFETDKLDDAIEDDIKGYASDKELIGFDDFEYVDYAKEIPKEEYDEAK